MNNDYTDLVSATYNNEIDLKNTELWTASKTMLCTLALNPSSTTLSYGFFQDNTVARFTMKVVAQNGVATANLILIKKGVTYRISGNVSTTASFFGLYY